MALKGYSWLWTQKYLLVGSGDEWDVRDQTHAGKYPTPCAITRAPKGPD